MNTVTQEAPPLTWSRGSGWPRPWWQGCGPTVWHTPQVSPARGGRCRGGHRAGGGRRQLEGHREGLHLPCSCQERVERCGGVGDRPCSSTVLHCKLNLQHSAALKVELTAQYCIVS